MVPNYKEDLEIHSITIKTRGVHEQFFISNGFVCLLHVVIAIR